MKKVAIVSCYFQHNYGSMLQAYATQKALDKLGYENETIDIQGLNKEIKKAKILYFTKASLTSDIFFRKFGMVKNIIAKKFAQKDYAEKCAIRSKSFEEFYKKNINLSCVYSSKKELGRKCQEKYHTVLVGSDQLWLPANIVADYYTLSFVPNTINTVAYATSFGQEVLPKNIEKKAKDFLQKIKHIGVREESGKYLIKKIAHRNVPVVCDPTMLFDAEEWMDIQKCKPIIEGNYIFCYFLGNNAIHRDFVKQIKAVTGYKVVYLANLDEYVKLEQNFADEIPYNIDPADFVNLVRNAAYVCTDSFHCSVFSIIYKRKFFTFRRFLRKTKGSTNTRVEYLLSQLGIEERLLTGNEDVQEMINKDIDYEIVSIKLNNLKEKSYDYLKTALLDNKDTDVNE